VLAEVLVVAHAGTTLLLAGLAWTVAVVVYPGFSLVTDRSIWSAFHDAHSRRVAIVVGPPWAVQGVAAVGLLLTRPAGVALWVAVAAATAALAMVGTTVLGAVPVHIGLGRGPDPQLLRRLRFWHWWRTAAWTGSAVLGMTMLLLADL
jgi:hypothetical protein